MHVDKINLDHSTMLKLIILDFNFYSFSSIEIYYQNLKSLRKYHPYQIKKGMENEMKMTM
jgi:hypothetical protein